MRLYSGWGRRMTLSSPFVVRDSMRRRLTYILTSVHITVSNPPVLAQRGKGRLANCEIRPAYRAVWELTLTLHPRMKHILRTQGQHGYW